MCDASVEHEHHNLKHMHTDDTVKCSVCVFMCAYVGTIYFFILCIYLFVIKHNNHLFV